MSNLRSYSFSINRFVGFLPHNTPNQNGNKSNYINILVDILLCLPEQGNWWAEPTLQTFSSAPVIGKDDDV